MSFLTLTLPNWGTISWKSSCSVTANPSGLVRSLSARNFSSSGNSVVLHTLSSTCCRVGSSLVPCDAIVLIELSEVDTLTSGWSSSLPEGRGTSVGSAIAGSVFKLRGASGLTIGIRSVAIGGERRTFVLSKLERY